MKNSILLLCLLPMLAFSQTTFNVAVFGGGLGNPDPEYDPQFLTIEVGDIVEWENTQGKHNIWGEWDIYPNNPVEFSNGQPTFAPWNFSFTFTEAGFYEYECTNLDHNLTQFGTITVIDPNSVNDIDDVKVSFTIYPNPASEMVNIRFEGREMESIEIVDTNGKQLKVLNGTTNTERSIDISDLSAGRYFMIITTTDDLSYSGPLLIE